MPTICNKMYYVPHKQKRHFIVYFLRRAAATIEHIHWMFISACNTYMHTSIYRMSIYISMLIDITGTGKYSYTCMSHEGGLK